ncbi:CRISPR-associated endonuclease Cas3'' [Lactobacillus sp. PSON]|uniref:CRISPR-associated endonuclease Cas3'' n=1 Tax=Lactobacillus sp. PSON TaxID=3455454 RepID=UPI004042277A
MMEFLAKSNGETLIDHTNNLLSQLKILKNTYPEILTRSDWELLQLACAYHDLGKINDKFQEKIRKNKWHIDGEIPHGLLSITLIPAKDLEGKFSEEQIWVLINSVARHHKRDFKEIDKKDIDSLKPLEKN